MRAIGDLSMERIGSKWIETTPKGRGVLNHPGIDDASKVCPPLARNRQTATESGVEKVDKMGAEPSSR